MPANMLYIAPLLVPVEVEGNMLKYVGIALVVALLAPEGLAAEMNCSQIENARDRLACFDRFFPRDPTRANVLPDPQPAVKASPPGAPSCSRQSTNWVPYSGSSTL